ncbi:DUF6953 family protein [Leucobacter sp. M11]|uniref:DUF6953 family protein n=1 Tax=Leucobacter sp. M11 TaxID=2993565 RepID=UPI002D80C3FC|nr:hypothetical protein [Leucobacter sp. M11]MEB4614397.1 hypothetical protein [Leucobacter sp. M11]
MTHTEIDVAEWLNAKIIENGSEPTKLRDAVRMIEDEFGADWVYVNGNGVQAISAKVLDARRALGEDRISWHGKRRFWTFSG